MRCCEILHRTRGPSHSGSRVTLSFRILRQGATHGPDRFISADSRRRSSWRANTISRSSYRSCREVPAFWRDRWSACSTCGAAIYFWREGHRRGLYSEGRRQSALIGLRTMLGLAIDVDRRANLSIEKRIETSSQRIAQLPRVVGASIGRIADARKLARDLVVQIRRMVPSVLNP
jgi:hypothetical protein